MQIAALVLAGALTILGSSAAGVPPEQLGQVPADTAVVEEQVTTGAAVVEEQLPPAKPETVDKPSSEKIYSVVLGEYTTKFSTANANRCSNIKVAAASMNGYIIEPGATFSFNSVVGRRTTARGYKLAPVISGGEYVDGVGGGVCQVSTTLFNAALTSNMKITERWAHSLRSSYVPAGRDATVSYGSADVKFVNPYSQPVKVVTEYNAGGSIRIAIMGPEGSTRPWVQLKVTGGPDSYTLTRTYDGKVNYTATSKYR